MQPAYMAPPKQNSAQVIILSVLTIVFVVVGVLFLLPKHDTPTIPTNLGSSTTVNGTADLLTVGVSQEVLNDFNFSVYRFMLQHPPATQTVSISNVEHRHVPGTLNDSYLFTLTVTNTAYNGTLTSSSLGSSAQLTLAQNNQSVFDSGSVDVNQ